jgi:hypothetical protein
MNIKLTIVRPSQIIFLKLNIVASAAAKVNLPTDRELNI